MRTEKGLTTASWSAMTFGAVRGCPVSLSVQVTIYDARTRGVKLPAWLCERCRPCCAHAEATLSSYDHRNKALTTAVHAPNKARLAEGLEHIRGDRVRGVRCSRRSFEGAAAVP